jgi:hypothetical protein
MATRAVAITTAAGKVSLENIECTIKAIDIRHKIVHEGLVPTSAESKKVLMGLFRTISSLLPGPKFKFPELS